MSTVPGRRERPVRDDIPELAELAEDLRELRRSAGLTLRQMAVLTYSSPAALSRAANGSDLPELALVLAWVRACDPEAGEAPYQVKHRRAAEAHQQFKEARSETGHDPRPTGPGPGESPAPQDGSEPASTAGSALDALSAASVTHRDGQMGDLLPALIRLRLIEAPADWSGLGGDRLAIGGHTDRIADILGAVPTRRLVVLGPSGSGKTQLALTLGHALRARSPAGRLACPPLLASLRGWIPNRQPLLHFLCDHLEAMHYIRIEAEELAGHLRAGSVTVLLDDFDDIEENDRWSALAEIAELITGPLVLFSTRHAYRTAIDDLDRPLPDSAAVLIEPVTHDALEQWLLRLTTVWPTTASKWQPVLARLREEPDDQRVQQVRETLSTPFMACCAALRYFHGRADPGELLDPDTSRTVNEHRLIATHLDIHSRRWFHLLGRHPFRSRTTAPPSRRESSARFLAVLRLLAEQALTDPEQRILPGALRRPRNPARFALLHALGFGFFVFFACFVGVLGYVKGNELFTAATGAVGVYCAARWLQPANQVARYPSRTVLACAAMLLALSLMSTAVTPSDYELARTTPDDGLVAIVCTVVLGLWLAQNFRGARFRRTVGAWYWRLLPANRVVAGFLLYGALLAAAWAVAVLFPVGGNVLLTTGLVCELVVLLTVTGQDLPLVHTAASWQVVSDLPAILEYARNVGILHRHPDHSHRFIREDVLRFLTQ
ncbi:helix-turn-helix domain-containing protein [Streptomyces bobili]|uniref:helix-turn-helix domain-containing protein n=1 Tax=Streptomyces bobili TaxID=67280 RepID=UPI0037B1627E